MTELKSSLTAIIEQTKLLRSQMRFIEKFTDFQKENLLIILLKLQYKYFIYDVGLFDRFENEVEIFKDYITFNLKRREELDIDKY